MEGEGCAARCIRTGTGWQRHAGEVANADVRAMQDIGVREFLVLTLLAVAVLWMGLQPKPFTDVMQVSVDQLLRHVAVSKLP